MTALVLSLLPAALPEHANAEDATGYSGVYVMDPDQIRIGTRVPAFNARGVTGSEVDYEALVHSGRPVILAFWCRYCKSCVEKFSALVALQTKYARRPERRAQPLLWAVAGALALLVLQAAALGERFDTQARLGWIDDLFAGRPAWRFVVQPWISHGKGSDAGHLPWLALLALPAALRGARRVRGAGRMLLCLTLVPPLLAWIASLFCAPQLIHGPRYFAASLYVELGLIGVALAEGLREPGPRRGIAAIASALLLFLAAREIEQQLRLGRHPDWRGAADRIAARAQGDPGVLTPEDAFVTAANSCIMLMFIWSAERFKLKLSSYECRAEGTKLVGLDRTETFTRLRFSPAIRIEACGEAPEVVQKRAARALKAAQKYSLVANSVKSEIIIEPRISII